MRSLRRLRISASSERSSAIISFAPCMASSTEFTSFSGSTNPSARPSALSRVILPSPSSPVKSSFARGSSPFSLAILARVRRLGR